MNERQQRWPPVPDHRASDPRKRVLVVEDDDPTREMMRDMLELDGFEVATENSAAHTLEMIEVWQPTLLVLDIMMGGVDGMQLLREIVRRELPVKVLVVTAYMPKEVVVNDQKMLITRESFQALGAWDLLVKPFDMQTLLDLAAEACSATPE